MSSWTVILLLLIGLVGYCLSYEDNNLDSHEIDERDPDPDADPDPARRFNRYSSSRYSSYHSGSSYNAQSSYGSSYSGPRAPTIDRFKVQNETEQNIADQCYSPGDYECDPTAKYRTVDGTCNNLRRPWWGSVNSAHVHLMPPYYEDGISEYRRSVVDSGPLPNPRFLSTTFLPNGDISNWHRRMYVQFSQLIAHDVTLNPQQSEGPKCCSESGDAVRSTSGNCRPISIPRDDSFFSQFNRQCMEYKQSETTNCSVGYLQPIIRSTSFIDVSFVYGSTPDTARRLRAFTRGQLRVRTVNGKAYMPLANASNCDPFARKNCYDAGDGRVNQHLDLAVSQTVWLRFHNYVAGKLIQLNPHWSSRDELVYQETRRIVGAIFQHITYNEWLPILIGGSYAWEVGLSPSKSGYFSKYNPNVNPTTLADFAGGAFRGLHSLIPKFIELHNEQWDTTRRMLFTSTMHHPGDFLEEEDTFDSVIRGLEIQREQMQDRFMTEQMTNFLMDEAVPEGGRPQFGDDLSARDIQRGRDFGLRPYVDYRQLCGLPRARYFMDLNDVMQWHLHYHLSQVYKDVRDVDYYIGGLLEDVPQGTLSSPSFRCVFVEAFYRYKYGDRYFYEGDPSVNPGAFTPAQLSSIKRVLLSQVICIGSDNISRMQRRAFYEPSESNDIVNCSRLQADFDDLLTCFRENV